MEFALKIMEITCLGLEGDVHISDEIISRPYQIEVRLYWQAGVHNSSILERIDYYGNEKGSRGIISQGRKKIGDISNPSKDNNPREDSYDWYNSYHAMMMYIRPHNQIFRLHLVRAPVTLTHTHDITPLLTSHIITISPLNHSSLKRIDIRLLHKTGSRVS